LSKADKAKEAGGCGNSDYDLTPLHDRLRDALEIQGIGQALLCHPESIAHLSGFSEPIEDWPVANPFLGGPTFLALLPASTRLVLADCYQKHAQTARVPQTTYRSYDIHRPPDPAGELMAVLDEIGLEPGPVGVEVGILPSLIAEALKARGCELVPIDDLVVTARRRKLPVEVAAIRRAGELADIVQSTVRELAVAGQSEAELAGLAQAAMYHHAGRRVPAVLHLTAGKGTETGGAEPTGNILNKGDILLTDTSPWIDGAWSDTCSVIVVGQPSDEQQKMFDAVRRALDLAIKLCRPGAIACEVDSAVRESLAEWGETYHHHTGHGIGASWSEEPRIVPYNRMQIEEDMVLAVEPAIYRPGFGGMRLEDVFIVRASGNERLTHFDHGL
jgi:Xaa-Pro dipeptidase